VTGDFWTGVAVTVVGGLILGAIYWLARPAGYLARRAPLDLSTAVESGHLRVTVSSRWPWPVTITNLGLGGKGTFGAIDAPSGTVARNSPHVVRWRLADLARIEWLGMPPDEVGALAGGRWVRKPITEAIRSAIDPVARPFVTRLHDLWAEEAPLRADLRYVDTDSVPDDLYAKVTSWDRRVWDTLLGEMPERGNVLEVEHGGRLEHRPARLSRPDLLQHLRRLRDKLSDLINGMI
jgi:hypothetical protein